MDAAAKIAVLIPQEKSGRTFPATYSRGEEVSQDKDRCKNTMP